LPTGLFRRRRLAINVPGGRGTGRHRHPLIAVVDEVVSECVGLFLVIVAGLLTPTAPAPPDASSSLR